MKKENKIYTGKEVEEEGKKGEFTNPQAPRAEQRAQESTLEGRL